MKRAVLVGGNGGRTRRYCDGALEVGFDLTHHERGGLPSKGRAASPVVVLIVVTAVSHPLRAAAEALARRVKAPVCYLTSASPEAVKQALVASAGAK